jgi:hypothetical protein
MYQYYTKEIKKSSALAVDEFFVFGSNSAGRHGAGAAKFARDYLGAKIGIGDSFTGRCYAIPTKGYQLEVLHLDEIADWVRMFKRVAEHHMHLSFYVTKIGCGLAGYKDHEIAPLFKGSPSNCKFHLDWKQYLEGVV